jgi:hypothetical protein
MATHSLLVLAANHDTPICRLFAKFFPMSKPATAFAFIGSRAVQIFYFHDALLICKT